MHAYYFHSHGKFIPGQFDLSFFSEFSHVHCMNKRQITKYTVSSQNGMGLKFSSRSVDITAPKCLLSFFFSFFTFHFRKKHKTNKSLKR